MLCVFGLVGIPSGRRRKREETQMVNGPFCSGLEWTDVLVHGLSVGEICNNTMGLHRAFSILGPINDAPHELVSHSKQI